MANWNKLTAKQFGAIKTLLRGGAKQAEAAEYMQVSPNTVFWVNKAETYEEYCHIKEEQHLSRKQVPATKANAAQGKPGTPAQPQEVVKEVRQSVTIQATHYMEEQLRKTNELLTLISNKLAFIVDELCGTPQK